MDDSAELFEAISHPVRIRILKILEKQPSSFASLKRQLNIDSSGNIDHHLKKLGQLIRVRDDGLYDLTDVGKEALLSIQAVDSWKEMERRKMKALGKIPKEAIFLALLELAMAVAATFSFFSVFPAVWGITTMGFFFEFFPYTYAVVAMLGFTSAFGVLAGKGWSWKSITVQSALVMLHSLIPFYYAILLWRASSDASYEIARFYPIGIFYAGFVSAEAMALVIGLRRPVKEFLGIKHATSLPKRALVGGIVSIASGTLTVLSGNTFMFSSGIYGGGALAVLGTFQFAGGLATAAGGVLILLRNYTLGGLIAIISCIYPAAPYIAAFSLVAGFFRYSILGIVVAAITGSLPIIGGILALVTRPKI